MTEVWKPVKGFEGLYEVSNLGRVKSVGREVKHSCGKVQKVKERIKKPQLVRRGSGYYGVMLYRNSKYTHRYIHRLVAEAFIPNPENKPEVNHKDGNTKNNRVDNLEWVTRKENIDHMHEKGLCTQSHRVEAISPDGEVTEYRSVSECARSLGVNHATVLNALKGVTKKSRNGYSYRYISKV